MSIYSAPSISNYNDTPPSDDGANTSANEVTWSGIKTKLGDPIKTYAQAISSATDTAFGKIFFNAVSSESSDYTVVTGDRGKLLSCTNTITITLVAAATAGDGFPLAIKNSGSGVITVDGYSSETINGYTTYTLYAGDMLVIACDGSNWIGQSTGNPSGLAVASGYTRIAPNYCSKDFTWSNTTLTNGANTTVSGPTNAKVVKVYLESTAISDGSAAWRYATIGIYTTSGFSAYHDGSSAYAQEPSGMSVNQSLGRDLNTIDIPLSATGGDFYLKSFDDGSGRGIGKYCIIGYYD